METIAELLTEDKETTGKITFQLTEPKVFDKNIKDVTVFYKLVGESRFKFFRSNAFELVFLHLTEDWMRQAKVDLGGVNCLGGIDVELAWDEEKNTMSVRGRGEDKFVTVTALHMDN
ncbi:MAG: hypothetical protein WCY82_03880 [Desulfotomaculaceae bacterium]